MLTIWKYELEEAKEQSIKMPVGIQILSVKTQYGKDVAYALVDTNQKDVLHEVTFRAFELEATEEHIIKIPDGAKTLLTKRQNEQMVLYTVVDENQKGVEKEIDFSVYGTGSTTKKDITAYELKITDEQSIIIPIGTQILSVKTHNENVILHTTIDTDQKDVVKDVKFRMHGTGHPVKEDIAAYTFLETVSLHGGSLMFHIFYKE